MGVVIRPMKTEDYEAAFALWSNCGGVGLRSLDDSREGILRFLQRNPGLSMVAVEQEDLVGVLLCGHDGRRGTIYHVAVRPQVRRKGIGRALVSAAIDAFRTEQIHKVALVVYSSNEAGNLFWEALGFADRADLIYRDRSLNELNF